MFRLRMIGKIIRQAGLGHITVVFFVLFFLCALGIKLTSPEVGTLGDSLWLCFQSMTTIGFGDLPTYRPACRAILVFLSLVSVFYLAVVTGVVVAYCNQLIQTQSKNIVVKLAYDLEHLDELSKDELREISHRAKEFL